MKRIIKNNEPRSLTIHRAAHGDFDGLNKTELRNSLLKEQGYLCCYCMRRIPQNLTQDEISKNTPDCKIEHFLCQTLHPNLELNYDNLLIACHGNHGYSRHLQTCDTHKLNNSFCINPANSLRNIESLLKYNANGEIFSDDPQLNSDLKNVLNLNNQTLCRIRKKYYEDIIQRIINEGKRRKGKVIPRKYYTSEKAKLLNRVSNKFPEYCMIGVYLINKKLNSL